MFDVRWSLKTNEMLEEIVNVKVLEFEDQYTVAK
jgi:hypothetical protein